MDYIDVYKSPAQFLACLLHWIKQRRDSSLGLRKQAVVTLIRRECHVFAGVGLHSVCEIFYLAGERPKHIGWCNQLRKTGYRAFPFDDRGGVVYGHVSSRQIIRSHVHVGAPGAHSALVGFLIIIPKEIRPDYYTFVGISSAPLLQIGGYAQVSNRSKRGIDT